MEPSTEIQPPPKTLSFKDLQVKVMDPRLEPLTRKAYLAEQGNRAAEITAYDPGFSSWLEGRITRTLREGQWNKGPDTLDTSSRMIAEEAQNRQANFGTGLDLTNQRYAGIVESALAITAETARVYREERNEPDQAKKDILGARRKRLENRNVANQFGILVTGERLSQEMSTKLRVAAQERQSEEAKKHQEELDKQRAERKRKEQEGTQRKVEEAQREAQRRKEAEEAEKKRKEEELRNLPFAELTARIVNNQIVGGERRQYREERARRVKELQASDPIFEGWVRDQILIGMQIPEGIQREDIPNYLVNTLAPQLARQATMEHPAVTERQIRGVIETLLGGLAREVRAINTMHGGGLNLGQEQAQQDEIRMAHIQQPLYLGLNLESLIEEADQRRKQQVAQKPQQNLPRTPEILSPQEAEQQALKIIEEIEDFTIPVASRANLGIPEDLTDRSTMRGLALQLERTLDLLSDNNEVKRLTLARLHLHDAEKTIRTAFTKGVKTADFLDFAYGSEALQRYELRPRDLEALFVNGLPVSEAFDRLRDGYLRGSVVEITREGHTNRAKVKLSDSKATEDDKKRIYDQIIEEMSRLPNRQVDPQRKANAELSLKLARRYAYVSGNIDIWNNTNYDGGFIATIINLQGYRETKDPHPAMTIQAIPALPVNAFERDVKIKRYDSRGRERGEEYLINIQGSDVITIRNSSAVVIDMRQVNWRALEESDPNAFRKWITNRVANALRVRDYICQSSYLTKDLLDPNFYTTVEKSFEKVAGKEDPLGLRAMWIACIYGEVMDATSMGTVFDVSLDEQVAKFEKALVTPIREGRSFLTRREKDWALRHGMGWGNHNQRGKRPEHKTINPNRPQRQFVNGKMVIND